MSDIMTILALMFGFALACVIGVVYLLSKRQISVVQNNSTSVTTTERTDSSTGGSGRFERAVIKWAFILLVAGIAIATLANAITTSFPAQRASIGNPQPLVIVATPVQMPTPVSTSFPAERVSAGNQQPITAWSIVITLLAVAVISIWAYAIIGLAQHRQRRRLIDTRRAAQTATQREAQLESILPDSVNQL